MVDIGICDPELKVDTKSLYLSLSSMRVKIHKGDKIWKARNGRWIGYYIVNSVRKTKNGFKVRMDIDSWVDFEVARECNGLVDDFKGFTYNTPIGGGGK